LDPVGRSPIAPPALILGKAVLAGCAAFIFLIVETHLLRRYDDQSLCDHSGGGEVSGSPLWG
jgi:hypothetical protein